MLPYKHEFLNQKHSQNRSLYLDFRKGRYNLVNEVRVSSRKTNELPNQKMCMTTLKIKYAYKINLMIAFR